MAEAAVSNTVQCGFESHPGHEMLVLAGARLRAPRSLRPVARPAAATGPPALAGLQVVSYTAGPMAGWLVERRLSQNAARLKELRAELAQLDEQYDVFASDADDSAIRALVSETPGAAFEANDARKHADAMARHRQHVVDTIRELERKQDELLDKLTSNR